MEICVSFQLERITSPRFKFYFVISALKIVFNRLPETAEKVSIYPAREEKDIFPITCNTERYSFNFR